MISRAFTISLAAALFLLAPLSLARAERPAGEISRITTEISAEIYSPFCPGKSLMMCPSPNAAEVRRDVQRMAAEGMEKQAIKEAIVERYGEEFRIVEPPAAANVGLGAALVVGLLLAIAAIFFLSRRRAPTAPAANEPGAPLAVAPEAAEDEAYLAALHEALNDEESDEVARRRESGS